MEELKHKKIAVPGENTTAFMVLKRFYPECTENIEVMRFDKIMPSLKNEEVDGGLVIHEGRFTFNQYNLTKVTDLGLKKKKTNQQQQQQTTTVLMLNAHKVLTICYKDRSFVSRGTPQKQMLTLLEMGELSLRGLSLIHI